MGIKPSIRIYILLLLFPFVSTLRAQQTVNVSLLMPFSSRLILSGYQGKNTELGYLCTQYYQGMLVALDSLKHPSKSLKLQVFDTENDSLQTLKIVKNTAFRNCDLIIGPVYYGGNKMVSAVTKEKSIYQLSPLMTFSKAKITEPGWVNANPMLPYYARIITQQIISQAQDSVLILVISDKSPMDAAISPQFKKLQSEFKKARISVVEYSPSLDIKTLISPVIPTHIVFPSTKEPNCLRIVHQLEDTSVTNQTVLYGLNQWLFDFKTVDIGLWQRKNIHFISPYFIDYDDERVKKFVEVFRSRFGTDPSEEAYKGYDQTRYFLQALLDHGKDFMPKLTHESSRQLHTTFRYQKVKGSELYHPMYLNILRFDQDKLIRIN